MAKEGNYFFRDTYNIIETMIYFAGGFLLGKGLLFASFGVILAGIIIYFIR